MAAGVPVSFADRLVGKAVQVLTGPVGVFLKGLYERQDAVAVPFTRRLNPTIGVEEMVHAQ